MDERKENKIKYKNKTKRRRNTDSNIRGDLERAQFQILRDRIFNNNINYPSINLPSLNLPQLPTLPQTPTTNTTNNNNNNQESPLTSSEIRHLQQINLSNTEIKELEDKGINIEAFLQKEKERLKQKEEQEQLKRVNQGLPSESELASIIAAIEPEEKENITDKFNQTYKQPDIKRKPRQSLRSSIRITDPTKFKQSFGSIDTITVGAKRFILPNLPSYGIQQQLKNEAIRYIKVPANHKITEKLSRRINIDFRRLRDVQILDNTHKIILTYHPDYKLLFDFKFQGISYVINLQFYFGKNNKFCTITADNNFYLPVVIELLFKNNQKIQEITRFKFWK